MFRIAGFRVSGFRVPGMEKKMDVPIMEKQMEKEMYNEMEDGFHRHSIGRNIGGRGRENTTYNAIDGYVEAARTILSFIAC